MTNVIRRKGMHIILAIIGIMLVSILAGCDNKSNTTFVDIDDEI